MARRLPAHIEGQLEFPPDSPDAFSSSIPTWGELQGTPVEKLLVLTGEPSGPHIAVADRAEQLIEAMNKLANINSLGGFAVAVTDPGHRDAIFTSYYQKGEMPKLNWIRKNAPRKVERLSGEVEEHFLQATGYFALKGTGWITRGEFRSRTDKDFKDFLKKMGTPTVNDDFNNRRMVQQRFLPKDHPLGIKPRVKNSGPQAEAA